MDKYSTIVLETEWAVNDTLYQGQGPGSQTDNRGKVSCLLTYIKYYIYDVIGYFNLWSSLLDINP